MPDFDNFPDDDELALLQFIEEFAARYEDYLATVNDDTDTRDAGIEFMNNVLAAADALDVAEFKDWSVPSYKDAYETVSRFRLFTKSFVIRSQVRKARLGKVNSVSLDTETKEHIHKYIAAIRELLERAEIEEGKRNSLYAKLNKFAADVDRARTPFDNAIIFIVAAADAAKKVGESLNPLSELIKRINELLGHAKDLEGDVKLSPPPERKRIEGPRKKADSAFSRDLDDVPF